MNYRHAYHAGNFADVIKHVILTALITSLARKDTPYCYIDTHAGTGYYDLEADQSKKPKSMKGALKKLFARIILLHLSGTILIAYTKLITSSHTLNFHRCVITRAHPCLPAIL